MNINRMEVNYWLHDSKTPGKAQIYCNITVKAERVEIGSTGITILRDHWNADTQRITKADPKSQFNNEILAAQELQLMAIFSDLFRRQAPITAGKIKRLWKKGGTGTSLITAFELFLKDIKDNPDRTGGTIEAYDDCRKKLIDFLIKEKALDMPVEDFDIGYLKKYRKWMKSIPVGDKIGHADSYVRKHSQTLKQVTAWASTNHLSEKNALEGFKIPGVKYDDPIFLTNEEFVTLCNFKFDNPFQQEVADIFIIYCRTGFHWGDLKDFVKKHKTALQRGINGDLWLIKNRIKTAVTIRVPQFKEVAAVVDKYDGWENLPVKSNKTMNSWLKYIAKDCGFNPKLSTKAGRKTFTDWCYNTLNLSTEAVMVMLGRKSSKGLEVYGKPDERRVISELNQSQAFQQENRKAS